MPQMSLSRSISLSESPIHNVLRVHVVSYYRFSLLFGVVVEFKSLYNRRWLREVKSATKSLYEMVLRASESTKLQIILYATALHPDNRMAHFLASSVTSFAIK